MRVIESELAEHIEAAFRAHAPYGPNPLRDMAQHAARIVVATYGASATPTWWPAPVRAGDTNDN
jgi:hypothetical protein